MKCLSWARGTISLSLPHWRWPGFSCPVELGLGATESTTFRAGLGGERGCPSPRKGMQILFKKDESRLTEYGQVWALSAQPSPHPGSRHLLSTPTSTPELLDWCGNASWDRLRRSVTVQNAICLFPPPVKTPQPVCHLGTLHPAVLGVFGNWIPNFQRAVSHVNSVCPTLLIHFASAYTGKT